MSPTQGPTNLSSSSCTFDLQHEFMRCSHVFQENTEVIGPMKLRLYVQLVGARDANLFVAVRKFRDGQEVFFEGATGWKWDAVTKGWLRVALRKLDEQKSKEWRPEYTFDQVQELKEGEIVELDISLLPSSTWFEKGTTMSVDVQGQWVHPHGILTQIFNYEGSGPGRCMVHSSAARPSYLLVPVVPMR